VAEPLPICYLNGKLLPLTQARISPLDRSFLFGDGVYEVIAVRHGNARRLSGNLARLGRSLNELQILDPHTPSQWAAIVARLIEANGAGDIYVYLQVSRGAESGRNHAPLPAIEPTVFGFCAPLPLPSAQTLECGVACITAADTRWARCDIKSVALLANVLLRQKAVEAQASETILLRDGMLTEASASSVYVISGGRICTPPNSNQLLPGTTRTLVEELADEAGIARHVDDITEVELRCADEVWLSAATRGVVAVTTIDRNPVADGKPGPLWRRMHELVEAYWAPSGAPPSAAWVPAGALAGLLCLVGSCLPMRPALAADRWLPISETELKMTSEPKAPGAAAVMLYREVNRSDAEEYEQHYVRIKILNDEGRKWANWEIPYIKTQQSVGSIEARTIEPDGTIVPFNAEIYDKPIYKEKNTNWMAKAFTLPAVEVGAIVEVRYTFHLPMDRLYLTSEWILSDELFTKDARFSLEPNRNYALRWAWPRGLPPGTNTPEEVHGEIRLEAHDIPAFVVEEHMPPAGELQMRVDFYYYRRNASNSGNAYKDPKVYWKIVVKDRYAWAEIFMDQGSAMRRAVAQVVQAGDSPEAKLRALYARAQQIRNVSKESRAQSEANHDQLEGIHTVADVWKQGFGSGYQINLLFVAMARAAGFDAYPVLLSARDRHFFDMRLMNEYEINDDVVMVKLDGKEIYLNPAAPFMPFASLPWSETGVEGLRIDRDGTWIRTPLPAPTQSRVERKVQLRLDDQNTLVGKVTVSYSGLEASYRRLRERHEDESARRRLLEEEIIRSIPTAVRVRLTNSPDWTGSDAPLVAEFELEVPGWATQAGKRELLAVGLFSAEDKHTFEHAVRVQPIYFDFPYQHVDDITIDVPQPWNVEHAPDPQTLDLQGITYKFASDSSAHSLHLMRELTLNLSLVDAKYYDALRHFYQTLRTCDEQEAVLSSKAAGAPQ
jgi:D-amino acid aminotransferase